MGWVGWREERSGPGDLEREREDSHISIKHWQIVSYTTLAMTSVDPHSGISLSALAAVTGCTPRTIRYYIARGLLPPPLKAGPGACYGEEHLRRLQQIRAWQAEGLTLSEIGHRLAGMETKRPPVLERSSWWSYHPASDVVVYVRADVSPWRARRIQRALQELAEGLAPSFPTEDNNHTEEP